MAHAMIVYGNNAATSHVVPIEDCEDSLPIRHQLGRMQASQHLQLLWRIDRLPIDQKELDI